MAHQKMSFTGKPWIFRISIMLAIESIGRYLILFGIILIVAGSVFVLFGKIPWFGRLPGDIVIRKEGFTFYFPVVTMVLLSIILTIIFNIIGRR